MYVVLPEHEYFISRPRGFVHRLERTFCRFAVYDRSTECRLLKRVRRLDGTGVLLAVLSFCVINLLKKQNGVIRKQVAWSEKWAVPSMWVKYRAII